MNRNLALLVTILAATICGCGGGTSAPPPPPAIAVTLSTMPPAMLAPGGTANVAATVTNDSASGGVKWSCTPASTCGSFNPTSTASAVMTTYTAPATVPSGGSVTIIATSVTDPTKSASAAVAISTNISVTLSTMPPASLLAGGMAGVAATVTNDSANAGVNWSCTPASTCGSFNPTLTMSAVATTYTAPATPPSGGSVTIIATSVTDPTKTASAPVVISGTASNATLKGQYAFIIRAPTGNPSTRGTTTFTGSVNLDGNGNLVQVPVQSPACTVPCAGMEDIVATKYFDQADPILPTAADPRSTYSVDASGHGTMTIETHQGETLSFSFVLTSASHALIIETNGEPGSGTLDLQSGPFTVAQISGAYAFTLEGVDLKVPPMPVAKLSFGGVFSSDGAGNITSGTLDANSNGTVTAGQAFTGTVFQVPDANGRGTFSVIPPAPAPTRTFTFYMVSPKVLRLFESDNIDLMGGSAYAQGAAAAALPGKFVFEHSGWSTTGRTVAAGQCATNGTTTVTGGVSDANAGGAPPTVPTTAKSVSGTFAIAGKTGTLNLTDAAGASTFNFYLVDPTLNILDPNNSSGGGGALLLHTDANIIGTGILIPQGTPASIVASQAISLRNSIASSTPNELDLVGVVTSDGAGNFKSGLADYDQDLDYTALGPIINAPFTGIYVADSVNAGHFTGSFSIPAPTGGYTFIPPAVGVFSFSLYQASGSQALVIQTDTSSNISGYLIQQSLP